MQGESCKDVTQEFRDILKKNRLILKQTQLNQLSYINTSLQNMIHFSDDVEIIEFAKLLLNKPNED